MSCSGLNIAEPEPQASIPPLAAAPKAELEPSAISPQLAAAPITAPEGPQAAVHMAAQLLQPPTQQAPCPPPPRPGGNMAALSARQPPRSPAPYSLMPQAGMAQPGLQAVNVQGSEPRATARTGQHAAQASDRLAGGPTMSEVMHAQGTVGRVLVTSGQESAQPLAQAAVTAGLSNAETSTPEIGAATAAHWPRAPPLQAQHPIMPPPPKHGSRQQTGCAWA